MNNKLKICLAICVILFLGFIIGVTATREFIKYRIEKTFANSGLPAMGAFIHMAREANLTKTQQRQMDEILKKSLPKWRKLFESHKPEIDNLFKETVDQIKTILNDEQKMTLENSLKRMMEHPKRFSPGPLDGPNDTKEPDGRPDRRDAFDAHDGEEGMP